MTRIMARICAKTGLAGELSTVLQSLLLPTRAEAGCLGYRLYQNENDACEFVTIEDWRDPAAAEEHLGTPHVCRAIELAGPLLAEPPRIHHFRELLP